MANATRVHVVGVNENKWVFYIVTSLECRVHLLSARYQKKKSPLVYVNARQASHSPTLLTSFPQSPGGAGRLSALPAQCAEEITDVSFRQTESALSYDYLRKRCSDSNERPPHTYELNSYPVCVLAAMTAHQQSLRGHNSGTKLCPFPFFFQVQMTFIS